MEIMKMNMMYFNKNWISESIFQFLSGPVWKTNIGEFIDNNSILFIDQEENSHENFNIHKKYINLIETNLEEIINNLGLTIDLFAQALIEGSKNELYKYEFEKILIADNFECFKTLMIKRNKEIEIELLKGDEKYHENENLTNEVKHLEKQKEVKDIELAEKLSQQIYNEHLKALEEEEKLLQQVLKMSEETYQKEEKEKNIEKENILKKQSKLDLIKKEQEKEKLKVEKMEEQKLKLIENINLKNNNDKIDKQIESLEERKKRLQEQRELLLQKKKEQNKLDLDDYNKNTQKPVKLDPIVINDNEINKRKQIYNMFKK